MSLYAFDLYGERERTVKLVPAAVALMKYAPCSLALVKFAFLMDALVKLERRRSRPEKSSLLHTRPRPVP